MDTLLDLPYTRLRWIDKTLWGFYCLPFLLVMLLVGYNIHEGIQKKAVSKKQSVWVHPKAPTKAKPTAEKTPPR